MARPQYNIIFMRRFHCQLNSALRQPSPAPPANRLVYTSNNAGDWPTKAVSNNNTSDWKSSSSGLTTHTKTVLRSAPQTNHNSHFHREEIRPCGTIVPQGRISVFNILSAKQKSDGQKTVALCWRYLFCRAVASQVSSAEMSLTTVFGMGTGGPSS